MEITHSKWSIPPSFDGISGPPHWKHGIFKQQKGDVAPKPRLPWVTPVFGFPGWTTWQKPLSSIGAGCRNTGVAVEACEQAEHEARGR